MPNKNPNAAQEVRYPTAHPINIILDSETPTSLAPAPHPPIEVRIDLPVARIASRLSRKYLGFDNFSSHITWGLTFFPTRTAAISSTIATIGAAIFQHTPNSTLNVPQSAAAAAVGGAVGSVSAAMLLSLVTTLVFSCNRSFEISDEEALQRIINNLFSASGFIGVIASAPIGYELLYKTGSYDTQINEGELTAVIATVAIYFICDSWCHMRGEPNNRFDRR